MTIISIPHPARTDKAAMKFSTRLQWISLLIVIGYEAAGGLSGGILLMASPDGKYMQMPVDLLNGVFRDFLIPGIILFCLGILNTIAFIAVLRKSSSDWIWAWTALCGWVIWFVTEIIVLQELHWLHIMWGLPVLLATIVALPLYVPTQKSEDARKFLLQCGIFSSIWYLFLNIFVPFFYDGYSHSMHTVSELSAINAPTRILWILLSFAYPFLLAAFAWGLLATRNSSRSLRITGRLMIIYCLFNLYWPPMHMRGIEPTLTDALHVTWASATVIFMMLMMGFGSVSFDKRFRIFTIVTMILLALVGTMTFMEAPNIPVNGPTPTIGIWERINIGLFLLWIVVLSVKLQRTRRPSAA